MFRVAGDLQAFSPTFNPLEFGAPFHGAWCEDPQWTAPEVNGEVLTWRNDGTAETDLFGEAGKVPTYVADGIGGKPALAFNGVNQRLRINGSQTDELPQAGTVIVVAQGTVLSNALLSSPASNREWYVKLWGGSLGVRINAGVILDSNHPVLPATPYVITAVYNGADSFVRVNGAEVARGDAGSNGLDGLILGNSRIGSDYWNGYVSCLLVYGDDQTGTSWYPALEDGLMSHYSAAPLS